MAWGLIKIASQKGTVVGNRVKVIASKTININQLEAALRAVNLSYDLTQVQQPGQALAVAQHAAAERCTLVGVAGDDMLINQVVNGLLRAATANPNAEATALGLLPAGSRPSSLAQSLDVPHSLPEAAKRLKASYTRLIDVGQVNDWFFVISSTLGLGPIVKPTARNGHLNTMTATWRGISHGAPWFMRLAWEGGGYEGPVGLVSIGNSGTFQMTPQASLDSGKLDVVCGANMARWQMAYTLPDILNGRRTGNPLVIYRQTSFVSVETYPATILQIDGQLVGKKVARLEYKLLPEKLRVVV